MCLWERERGYRGGRDIYREGRVSVRWTERGDRGGSREELEGERARREREREEGSKR